jgi:hypothetical protein
MSIIDSSIKFGVRLLCKRGGTEYFNGSYIDNIYNFTDSDIQTLNCGKNLMTFDQATRCLEYINRIFVDAVAIIEPCTIH